MALVPATGSALFYAEDFLGSSRAMVQSTGTLCYDADFGPFGYEKTQTNTCPTNYKFEGKERDAETQNDDFGAREYSWRLGRWLSSDWSAVPVAVPYANLTNPQTLNLYSKVSDDPESFADLDGHCGVLQWITRDCPKPSEPVTTTPSQAEAQKQQQDQPQVSEASVGVMALPILARAGVGAMEGGEGGAVAGTVEPGGGNVVGALGGAVIGAAVAVVAPQVYEKSKVEAGKAWTKLNTAIDHLASPNKLGGPDKNPRGKWKQTMRRAANEMDQHANRMTGHQDTANAIRFAADLIRGLIPNDPI